MKILFLDHYGVMVLSQKYANRNESVLPSLEEIQNAKIPDKFNKDAVNLLNAIIEKTNCEIVVTSDWKTKMSLGDMKSFYKSQGVSKSPLSYTDSISAGKMSIPKRRSLEILNFIERGNIDKWAAVDDLYLGNYLPRFVWCQFPHLGILGNGIISSINDLL